MSQLVTFPGMGLELNIPKVAFNIFGVNIYWYAIIIVSAIVLSLILLKIKLSKKENRIISFDDLLELLIIVLPVSIICARLYYVMFNLQYYLEQPLKIFDLRSGGLAIYGGLIGGLIVIYFFAKKKNIHILDVTDLIVPYIALSQSIGRWGNFVNVEAYGYTTNLPWRMGVLENGIYNEVHPAFLYESIGTMLIFIILAILGENKKFRGEITYIYIILYSLIRMLIENIRKDSLMLYNLRISGVLSCILFVIFSIILIYKIINKRKTNK